MAKDNMSKVFNFIAFIGLCCVAVVLILQKVLKGDFINAIGLIGQCIAYFITAVSAFFYVRSKRNVWWYIAYTVAVVLIVVFIIIK